MKKNFVFFIWRFLNAIKKTNFLTIIKHLLKNPHLNY